ncbi:MAG: metal ABC transporter ATP-binding protein [Verrucomicrobia bacterium]|nr:metal ABC transporter ATP-binding protein [Verrucomicrobiota bacterium]
MSSSHRLSIKDLTVSYQRVPALHHIDLELRCGKCVALLGPNGAGKTTFLKSLAGLLPFETGTVVFEGHEHTHARHHTHRHQEPSRRGGSERCIAYLPQRSVVDWDFPLTVRGLVEMGRFPALGNWGRFKREDRRIVQEALAATHLQDLADRQISALSGGQQQRAFLARAWAQHAHIYLLDEPFTGLDRNAQTHLGELLRRLSAEEGKLVIVSHHDLKTVPDLFDQVIFLNGELVAFGDVAEVFTPERIAETFSTHVFTG